LCFPAAIFYHKINIYLFCDIASKCLSAHKNQYHQPERRTNQKQLNRVSGESSAESTAPLCEGADHQGAGMIPPRARLKAEPEGNYSAGI
jgi:hypothetical protein